MKCGECCGEGGVGGFGGTHVTRGKEGKFWGEGGNGVNVLEERRREHWMKGEI